ncbi:MAG: hypothetical protein GX606_01965 [Elusimicrobia bacterium]|nr:hypothetical protein [Elusimicrobiota bacterium]
MKKHYLCLCANAAGLALRDDQLGRLKAELFPDPAALRFDCEELDGRKLSVERFKIALGGLPAVAAQRLIHLRQAEKINAACEALLLKVISGEEETSAVLFLEAATWPQRTSARKAIAAGCVILSHEEKEVSVFDLMDRLADRVAALKILKEIQDREEAPEKLLGGMVWAWANKYKRRLSAESYKKGLLILQEADRHLKRSHYPQRGQAVEIAVIRLSLLAKAS